MRVVIIGGVAAGMSAAMEIVRHDKDAEIITLEKGFIYSYGQCGLPYVIDGRIAEAADLIARSPEQFQKKYGIDARVGHEVDYIDYDNQLITGYNVATNERFELTYDKLLIATGAAPVLPAIEGVKLKGIQTFKTIPETEALLQELPHVKHVTIVGGGYIGLEVAEALKLAGFEVTIVQRGERLAKNFDAAISHILHDVAIENGVDVLLNEEVIRFEGTDRVERVVTSERTITTDLVVVAIGVQPSVEFARHQKLHMLPNGAILTNEQMETSIPNVYAAGDCAAQYHRLFGKHIHLPLGTTANKQGRVAGLSIAGFDARFKGIVGTSIFQFFNAQIGGTGWNEATLKESPLSYESYTLEGNHIASYYPGKKRICTTLYYDTFSRQLLGAQFMGEAGVDKRVDVIATALYAELTIDQLLDLDLAYAPPFNGAWDPVQQVARRLQR